MSGERAALAAAAQRFVGVPFRLHGRDPARGLDCVGLVAASLAAVGREGVAPAGYRLRQTAVGGFLEAASRSGLVDANGPVEPGDVLLLHPGPAQYHLAIAAADGAFVHADAGLARVVLAPACDWPIDHHWRLAAE